MSVSSTSNAAHRSAVDRAISVIANPSKRPSEVQAELKKLEDLTPAEQNEIQMAMQQAAQHQSFISNILRTLHETAMNTIRNIRS